MSPRERHGRRRIVVGYSGLALLALAAMLVTALSVHASEYPPMLVAATGGPYSTTVMGVNTGTEPVSAQFSRCIVSPPVATVLLAPGKAATVTDLDAACLPPFALLEAPAGEWFSLVRFDDGQDRSDYVLPVLGAIDHESMVVLDCGGLPCVSSNTQRTYVTVFPPFDGLPLLLTLYDVAGDADPIVEECTIAYPVGQCEIQARGLFRVGVRFAFDPLGLWSGSYGMVSSGNPDGGSVRVTPFPVE